VRGFKEAEPPVEGGGLVPGAIPGACMGELIASETPDTTLSTRSGGYSKTSLFVDGG
jgi:hypothetical protein